MIAEIHCDERSNFKLYLVIGEWCDKGGEDNGWEYIASIMPEGNCADWAEKFWDACFEKLKGEPKP